MDRLMILEGNWLKTGERTLKACKNLERETYYLHFLGGSERDPLLPQSQLSTRQARPTVSYTRTLSTAQREPLPPPTLPPLGQRSLPGTASFLSGRETEFQRGGAAPQVSESRWPRPRAVREASPHGEATARIRHRVEVEVFF